MILSSHSVIMCLLMNTSESTEKNLINILIERGILTFSFSPPYVYTTGLKSPIYIDNRMLISFPKERTLVVKELINLIKGNDELKNIEYISSSLSYAAPFGVLVANELSLPLVLIREEHRIHGKRNRIEGHLPKGSKVLVVEDHISTGAALVDNALVVRENGGEVSFAVAITDYGLDSTNKSLLENNLKSFVLARGIPMVKEGTRRGLITKQEELEVLDWFKDPVKWGEDRGYYSNSN